MKEAYIFDAVRTPRGKGKTSGSLHEIKPIDLLKTLFDALQKRLRLDTTQVEDVILGCVTPMDEQGGNIAKTAAYYAGWGQDVAGMQINRFCASGSEAVNLAAMKIRSGWEDMIVAGGIESMSRVPMGTDGGAMVYDPVVSTKIRYVPQGIAADLLATKEHFSREKLDEYAFQSQQRAAFAIQNNYFKNALIPVTDQNGLMILDHDEYVRPETTLEILAALKPAFAHVGETGFDEIALQKYPMLEMINHFHTAGNSSGIVDGAALLLIGSLEKGTELGLTPRAKIVGAAISGAEPTVMLEGPTPATLKALKKAGLQPKDIDLWEMNEAFAAPVLKFQQDFNIPNDIFNVNGGSIALGHPLGATGAILIGSMLDELERRDLKRGLITLCVGGGMGISTIIERV
jgi:acetyl-CoA C-acetyltransferase